MSLSRYVTGVRTSLFLYKIWEKEYLFCPDGIQKNKGLNFGAEPPHIRRRCRVLSRVRIKALILIYALSGLLRGCGFVFRCSSDREGASWIGYIMLH